MKRHRSVLLKITVLGRCAAHAVTQGEEGGDEKFGITEVGVEVMR
jgi:hypothetical protein